MYVFVTGSMSAENKNADVQWLVTLALDGIWSSVTEVGGQYLLSRPAPCCPSTCVYYSAI